MYSSHRTTQIDNHGESAVTHYNQGYFIQRVKDTQCTVHIA